jgi:hypothetical protein
MIGSAFVDSLAGKLLRNLLVFPAVFSKEEAS